MRWYSNLLTAFYFDRRAITSLDYALIAAIIGAVIVTNIATLGNHLATEFSTLAGKI